MVADLRTLSRRTILRMVHDVTLSGTRRGYLRRWVVEMDFQSKGYTFVGQAIAIMTDEEGWPVSLSRMFWYIMNMAYFRPIGRVSFHRIVHMCKLLANRYGMEEQEYFVPGNSKYPVGNLMTLRPDVFAVIAEHDLEAYMRLIEGIGLYDERGFVLGAYDNQQ